MCFKKYISVLSLFAITFIVTAQDITSLKVKRESLLKEIQLTSQLLETTNNSALSKYNELSLLRNKINLQSQVISNYRKEVKYIDNRVQILSDSILLLNKRLDEIRSDYAKIIYHTWQNSQGLDQLMYVLAGKDINQSYRRLRYLSEYNRFRKDQAILLQNTEVLLRSQVVENQNLKSDKVNILASERQELSKLETQRSNYDKQIALLNTKKAELRRDIKKKQSAADLLNKEITSIIEREVKKSANKKGNMELTPEENLVASNFAGNKGKLPWPVERGVIISHYGKKLNTILKNEYTFRDGIDIQTDIDGEVRSVYDGIVSGIYAIKGHNQTIIIKHGNYFSLYSNISEVYVKAGDLVKTKESIGKCYNELDNNSILHFQIWKERIKQNPEEWIMK